MYVGPHLHISQTFISTSGEPTINWDSADTVGVGIMIYDGSRRINMNIRDKISSGRWLITMFAGLSFLGMTYADVNIAIHHPEAKIPFSPEALFSIISSVAAFYFSKPSDEKTAAMTPQNKDTTKIDPPAVQQ
jgi:hypothetical protein